MNKRAWRLVLAGVCVLVGASAARAQSAPEWVRPPLPNNRFVADDSARPSHRPLDGGVGDISQAEDLLSHRLHRNHNLQDFQDVLKPLLDNPEFLKQLKGMKPEDLQGLQEAVKNHPELLDDPKLKDVLKQVDQLKHGGNDLSDDKKKELEQWAKGFLDAHKKDLPHLDPVSKLPIDGPPDSGRPQDVLPKNDVPARPPVFTKLPPSQSTRPNWLNRDMVDWTTGLLKDLDRSPEGESLRTAALHELAKMDSRSSGSSSGLTASLKDWIPPDDAAWLARNLKLPSLPNFGGGWSAGPSYSGGSPGAGSSGVLDGLVWAAALALLGAAAWTAFSLARKQAANARSKPWTPGPWPVPPSRVSTREDLIRAFEHLAFLCLGPVARTLNHLDVAARLGEKDADRAAAAARLARLYEQARYAPADELLPADELTAARGDLTALAGAAA